MPVLSDFVVIQGDASKRIGDGATLWEKNFNTGGRHAGGHAILMYMVKGLTVAKKDPIVKINNREVGKIFRTEGANRNYWFTQIINIGPNILNNGNNEIQIEAVDYVGGGSDHFDDFFLRDVVCLFQQSS